MRLSRCDIAIACVVLLMVVRGGRASNASAKIGTLLRRLVTDI